MSLREKVGAAMLGVPLIAAVVSIVIVQYWLWPWLLLITVAVVSYLMVALYLCISD